MQPVSVPCQDTSLSCNDRTRGLPNIEFSCAAVSAQPCTIFKRRIQRSRQPLRRQLQRFVGFPLSQSSWVRLCDSRCIANRGFFPALHLYSDESTPLAMKFQSCLEKRNHFHRKCFVLYASFRIHTALYFTTTVGSVKLRSSSFLRQWQELPPRSDSGFDRLGPDSLKSKVFCKCPPSLSIFRGSFFSSRST